MLRKTIVPVFEKLLDIIFVLAIIGAAISGASTGGIAGCIIGIIGSAIFMILTFGVIYILLDIRDNLRKNAGN